MLLHHMTLISFWLFRKKLDNLREFLEQIVYRPPGEKLPVRPWAKREKSVNFQLVVKNGGKF